MTYGNRPIYTSMCLCRGADKLDPRTQTTATVTSNEGRKTKDIKNFILKEALKFDPADWQNVLLIGLGGGTQNNFLSAVDFVKVNLTTVELSPLMVTIATDWFGLLETRTNNVFVEDGVDYLHGAVQRDEKYRSIILDACTDINQSIICPAKDFMRHSVIQDIARILDDEGVLTVNILSSRDYIANEDNILSTFKKHFSTCFLLRYNETQRLLVCTKKERWSFNEERARFTKNFQNVDDRFDFGLSDVISREN
ncbi:hypothetical protein TELCIR_09977 [Teladorsagia circumcincta]|uniref:Uncharacterized protein n=1 Tax=Teladorsagia circumcincta TaxID=45464 RepID=A0A2G9UFH9_TELCI|nr:hypothetical protein TELCIR_09977 [Teladorsagia circumcincta]